MCHKTAQFEVEDKLYRSSSTDAVAAPSPRKQRGITHLYIKSWIRPDLFSDLSKKLFKICFGCTVMDIKWNLLMLWTLFEIYFLKSFTAKIKLFFLIHISNYTKMNSLFSYFRKWFSMVNRQTYFSYNF